MVLIDNQKMLSLFSEYDEVKHFYACHDITMAGREGYKITKVEYYAENEQDPLSSYCSVKTYNDTSLLVSINSQSIGFASEIAEFLSRHSAPEIDIGSNTLNLKELECFNKRFAVIASTQGSPTYGIYSESDLPALNNALVKKKEGYALVIADAELKAKSGGDPSIRSLLDEDFRHDNSDIFWSSPCFKDTKHYCILKEDKILGFLRAECGYKNYYDIGWVDIAPEYRNRGLGKLLTLYFAWDCFNNGNIPHYGYAVSEESVLLARSCGFTETRSSIELITIKRENKIAEE